MYHNKIRTRNGILFLAFQSGNLTATVESPVDCLKRKRWSVWRIKSTKVMTVKEKKLKKRKMKRQRLGSQVGLWRLQQRKENVSVDKLACVGYGEARKRPCGRVSLCGLRQ